MITNKETKQDLKDIKNILNYLKKSIYGKEK